MAVTGDDVLAQVGNLRQWRRGDQRAPHKPLLLLLALGRMQAGRDRLASFDEIAGPLRQLLEQFGPPRGTHRPQYPFWRLRLDGELWDVEGADQLAVTASGDPSLSTLRQPVVRGGLNPAVAHLLAEDQELFDRVVAALLHGHFPPSLHDDICSAVGLRVGPRPLDPDTADRARRDPEFRVDVLRAYEYRCAMCGYDGRLDSVSVGLDAAHVRWWACDGPDTIDNGLALCALHHRALDRGIVGISSEHRIRVSRRFHGGARARALIIDLAGAPLRPPQAGLPSLAGEYLDWHSREVFSGNDRPLASQTLAAEAPTSYGG